ncbi:hypothetical protein GPECTOR_83g298 [Gonium pectorale]|uniref:U-box domain-containing protein n=1 Tax=Gonium pectorale TaxID=33097 RepID=A0A150G1D7_GONPE|nr:hypothetical protein GPECTOR_83g298 [Gonium pectorale]|eukprot:KXZ43686.1 hypothetical protein GPECTOR_83g298 [Gonium pectorale]
MDGRFPLEELIESLLHLLNEAEAAVALGPIAALLVKGPLLVRLRGVLARFGEALEALGGAADAEAIAVEADGRDRIQRAAQRLGEVRLQALELGATWYRGLQEDMCDATAGPEADAVLSRALGQAGIAADVLHGAEVREGGAESRGQLVSEVLDLSAMSGQREPAADGALFGRRDRELLERVAEALLFAPPSPSQQTPAPAAASEEAPSPAQPSLAAPPPRPLVVPPSPQDPRPVRLPGSLMCPITQSVMRDPVNTATGHTYERSAIEAWLQGNDVDPMTKERLPHKTLVPAWAVKGVITELLEQLGMTHDQYDEQADMGGLRTPSRRPAPPSSPPRPVPPPAPASPAPAPAAPAAPAPAAMPGPFDRPARLFDYVTAAPNYRSFNDAADGPLAPGKYGIVLMDDRSPNRPLRIRSLQEPFRLFWYERAALQPVPAESLPAGTALALPSSSSSSSSPADMGTPVTLLTSDACMLVRRGYDWRPPEGTSPEREAELRAELRSKHLRDECARVASGGRPQVGTLAATSTGGRSWTVHWQGGGEEVLCAGEGNRFELQHVQVHRLSGAPVRAGSSLTPGCAVMRGLYWTWGEDQDGGAGTVGTLEKDDREGCVNARWPNRRRANYRASAALGFDLNYVARPAEAVTVYNAQRGLLVCRGPDWGWGDQDGGGGVGRLQAPAKLAAGQGVWWKVQWANDTCNQYRVGKPGSGWCDLQIATYEDEGETGFLRPGTVVTITSDLSPFPDASSGPLAAGELGMVVQDGDTMYEVEAVSSRERFWYERGALRPLPGRLAVDRCAELLRLNREGRAAMRGRSGGTGGDTGRQPEENYYCGHWMSQCRCGRCDGQCGPNNGCPCYACAELAGRNAVN